MSLTIADRISTARRDRLDVVAFLGAVAVGVGLYMVLRWMQAPQYLMTLAVVGVMGAYALAVANVGRLRVRLDQAGDNAYYLGLLFTLGSMALALYEFGGAAPSDSEAAASRVIANFGIALASTIIGIFLRVLLHQMRVDPADIENVSRIELSEAASRVKSTLDHVSITMASASDELTQRTHDHLTRLHERAELAFVAMTESFGAATTKVTGATASAQEDAVNKLSAVTEKLVNLATELQGAASRLASVEPPPLKLATRLEKVAAKLDELGTATERAAQLMDQAGASSGTLTSRAEAILADMARIADAATQNQNAAVQHTHSLAGEIATALSAVQELVERHRLAFAELDEHVQKSSVSAIESQEAARRVLDSLVEATDGLVDLVTRAGQA